MSCGFVKVFCSKSDTCKLNPRGDFQAKHLPCCTKMYCHRTRGFPIQQIRLRKGVKGSYECYTCMVGTIAKISPYAINNRKEEDNNKSVTCITQCSAAVLATLRNSMQSLHSPSACCLDTCSWMDQTQRVSDSSEPVFPSQIYPLIRTRIYLNTVTNCKMA